MSRYERIHKCCEYCRIHYAEYIVAKGTMFENLRKSLSANEVNWLLDNHTELCLRQNHHLFEYDDLARAVIKDNEGLAIKIYKIAEKLCKNGMDYSFLAISVYDVLRDLSWCKELYQKAKSSIKDGFCYVNMLNFIEIKAIDKNEANWLLKTAFEAKFDAYFYFTIACELRCIDKNHEFVYKFFKKAIDKDPNNKYFLESAYLFIKDKDELGQICAPIKRDKTIPKHKPKKQERKSIDECKRELSDIKNVDSFTTYVMFLDKNEQKQEWVHEAYKNIIQYAKEPFEYAYLAGDMAYTI
ncbi:MAG: hypothetical protein LUC34_03490 [Campylobacter sp.]|nr:hypothetical protein [Campylobacter sp.]